MEYLQYPSEHPDNGKWPTDIAKTDTHSLRLYIKWQHPDAFKKDKLPVTSNKQLVDYLTANGYKFGVPYYAEQ